MVLVISTVLLQFQMQQVFLTRLNHCCHHTKRKTYILRGQHAIFLNIILCNFPVGFSYQLFGIADTVWNDTAGL
jgi:hypothetical protein